MTMTLVQMADELLAIVDGDRPRLNKTEMREYVRDLLAANAAHLTQPAQACEHDWAVGYGVPAYCNHCGIERDPKPAQSVDVEKVREVIESHINEAKNLRHDPESQDYLYEQADKLAAALQENGNG